MAPACKVLHDIDEFEFKAVIDQYREMFMPWKQISDLLKVNIRWLQRWKQKVHYQDPVVRIFAPNELDALVARYMFDHPERGERMLLSCFRNDGYYVNRHDLRLSIGRVDSVGRSRRLANTIHRRTYKVEGPHHLWHLDGNHKLIHFHIVVHGAVDGFSRTIVFLRASDNNRASTVLTSFKEATNLYGIPSRIRIDRGGENVDVAEYMIACRGSNRGTVLAGKSTHNQRIERLWRDVRKDVINYYIILFSEMEARFNLNMDHPIVIFVLHALFLNSLNDDLDQYVSRWNNHSVSTERNHTPKQLLALNQDTSAAVFVDEDYYGLAEEEEDGEEANEAFLETHAAVVNDNNNNSDNNNNANILKQVELNPLPCPLTPQQLAVFNPPSIVLEDSMEVKLDKFIYALNLCGQLYH